MVIKITRSHGGTGPVLPVLWVRGEGHQALMRYINPASPATYASASMRAFLCSSASATLGNPIMLEKAWHNMGPTIHPVVRIPILNPRGT